MPQASGVYKQLIYKVANTAGIASPGAGGRLLRRVTSTLDRQKDVYESGELRSDLQRADYRHGVRRAMMQLNGELSPGTYADFFAGALKRDYTVVTAITGLSITVAGAGPSYTLTRGAGDWLTSGVKVGLCVRLTAGGFAAANLNKNLLVAGVTSTVLTVFVLNGSALVGEGPISSAACTVVGRVTFTPQTGHIEKFFSLEHWSSEVPSSETGHDMRVTQVGVNMPATGLVTVQVDLQGVDVTDAATQRFTGASSATTTGLTAAVNGLVLYQAATVAVITSLSMTISCAFTGEPVVGSNIIPTLSPGRVIVKGQATIKYVDTVFRDAFRDEAEVALALSLSSDNSANSEFLNLILSRIKLAGAGKDDGEKEIVQTVPFEALLNRTGGTGTATELTTLMVQDSAAT